MYLKEIKAHGFKSFADKTSIELNQGITGIVGPNGSGKSNVVDAIRWVLGEQSVKSLRGDGNMTDVIFSGSKSRNPQNVASVTLVLDNSDKFLPIGYEEIAIKRRLYKDGANEYFLNNEKCRLKDITDILLDSGISKESFNIISQGKIEEIISSKPTDRRVIFEEAAGVLKYKKRKEEALRKLDKTHNNMNRVNDIINELELQIEPLKNQRDKALQYNEISDELLNIEIGLITSDITNINYNYKLKKEKIDELNNQIMQLSTEATINEAKTLDYKNKITKIDEDIKQKQKQLMDTITKVEKINSQKQIILERQKYQVEDAKLHNNLIELKETELKIKNEMSNLANEMTSISKDNEKIIIEVKTLEEKIQTIKNERNKLELDLTIKLRAKTNLETKIETLKESIENNSTLPYAVKNVLNNPKLRGIHNALGNLIECDEKVSIAVNTALGFASTNVVVDNDTSAKEAINYLKNNNYGRATFLPLTVIKPKSVDLKVLDMIKKETGFVDLAVNLVKYDRVYHNVISNQLGNVIVTTDIDSANIISKKIDYKYRIVTTSGELLHVGGSVTGGSNNKTRNIISDKYDLEHSIKDLNKLIEDIKNKENEINEVDYRLKSIEDKLYLLTKEKINIEELIKSKVNSDKELKDKLNMVMLEINGTNNILSNTLTNEEDAIINEYYSALKEKETIENDYNDLIKEKNYLSESLEDFEYSIKKENSEFNSKNSELKNLEIEVNRMDVKLDNLLNTLGETYNITYESAKEVYRLELEESVARTKVNGLKRKLKEIGEVNTLAPAEYERVSTRYEFLLNQKTDLTNAENTLLEIISEMDRVMKKEFIKTFDIIKNNFIDTFKQLFKGGTADLKLTNPSDMLETGIEIIASPPGKKLSSISLLSGGEKTLTAISLLFAIIKSRPSPFCVLDEVEAALDEVNVVAFGEYIKELKNKTQFILITHKKKTMEFVDILYGITMQESGVSKLVSVKLEEIK